jgi:hypothetical protein
MRASALMRFVYIFLVIRYEMGLSNTLPDSSEVLCLSNEI